MYSPGWFDEEYVNSQPALRRRYYWVGKLVFRLPTSVGLIGCETA